MNISGLQAVVEEELKVMVDLQVVVLGVLAAEVVVQLFKVGEAL